MPVSFLADCCVLWIGLLWYIVQQKCPKKPIRIALHKNTTVQLLSVYGTKWLLTPYTDSECRSAQRHRQTGGQTDRHTDRRYHANSRLYSVQQHDRLKCGFWEECYIPVLIVSTYFQIKNQGAWQSWAKTQFMKVTLKRQIGFLKTMRRQGFERFRQNRRKTFEHQHDKEYGFIWSGSGKSDIWPFWQIWLQLKLWSDLQIWQDLADLSTDAFTPITHS